MVKFTTICVLLMVRLRTPSCELFSSVAKMAPLLQTQAHLIHEMEKIQHVVYKKERKIVKRFLANLKKDHVLFEQDPEHFLGNPINSLTLVMRLFRDLLFVETFLNQTTSYKRNAALTYPGRADVVGVIHGMARIQLMYDLVIAQIANGTLITSFSQNRQRYVENVSPMTGNDCLILAMMNLKDDRSKNIAWLKAALRRYDRYLCSTFSEEYIIAQITAQYYIMKNWNSTIFWLEKRLSLKPDDYSIIRMLEQAKKKYEEEPNNPEGHAKGKEKTVLPLMLLCRNELFPVGSNSRLSCYYSYGPHPFLLLAPIKTELLYEDPYIAMFYDVITDREVQALKILAKPKLHRANVYDEDDGSHKLSDLRISQNTHVSANPVLSRVLRRVHQFSGLQWNKATSEAAQIANYGIGGQFEVHYDVMKKGSFAKDGQFSPQIATGHRLATALIYMSEVEQGGATVFVKINLTIFPVKNAAIFWFNLNPWGVIDLQTQHAACPVLRGSKWVLTKWINLAGHEIRRPCPVYTPPPPPDNDNDG